jgi:hypothetical protein
MSMGKCYFQNSPCGSRFVALALDEERLHLLVLQDLHGRLLGSVALRNREECPIRLSHHSTGQVVLGANDRGAVFTIGNPITGRILELHEADCSRAIGTRKEHFNGKPKS